MTRTVVLAIVFMALTQNASAGITSCVGKCSQPYNSQNVCQCNIACPRYNNCCNDYIDTCLGTKTTTTTTPPTTTTTTSLRSCSGRCSEKYDKQLLCQCNAECPRYGNCCNDFQSLCTAKTTPSTTKPTTTTTIPSSPQTVSDNEVSQILQYLWNVDSNYAVSGQDFATNLQGRIRDTSAHRDVASSRLLSLTNEAALFNRGTYRTFRNLLDNYKMNTGVSDYPTSSENREVDEFLLEVMKTNIMQSAWSFLKSKGHAPSGESLFIKQLRELWFTLYSRANGRQDSSGFEHVFVGEIKNGEISGFHNWLNFYTLERRGTLDYKGYLRIRSPNLLVAQFAIAGAWKDVGSMIVGTSPEFELAAYTICFLVRPNDACQTSIDGSTLKFVTYDVDYLSKVKRVVGTAFPVG